MQIDSQFNRKGLSLSLLFSAKRQNRIELTNRMIELLFDQIQIRKLKLYRLVKVCEQATTAGKKMQMGSTNRARQ